jgi:hypothetical protein
VAVLDKEVVTVTYDSRTQFTKWITQKPWQQNTTLTASALLPGRLVYIATHAEEPTVASWIHIATDVPMSDVAPPVFVRPVRAVTAVRSEPTTHPRSEDHANAKDQYLQLAARYEADAAKHEREAAEYRRGANAAESKRPMSPDTALHCERLAAAARTAATEARALAEERGNVVPRR